MTTGVGSVLRKKLSRIQSHGYNFPVQSQLNTLCHGGPPWRSGSPWKPSSRTRG